MASHYLEALAQRVLVFDGAMGTEFMARELDDAAFGGAAYHGCNEALVLNSPHIVTYIHEQYLEAGCDVLETDSFTASRLKLDEYGLGAETPAINFGAARLAREAADRFSTPERPRFVAGALGPTGMLISSSDPALSKITFDELAELYREQAVGADRRRRRSAADRDEPGFAGDESGDRRDHARVQSRRAARADSSAGDARRHRPHAARHRHRRRHRDARRAADRRHRFELLDRSRAHARCRALSGRQLALLRQRDPQRRPAADGRSRRDDLSRAAASRWRQALGAFVRDFGVNAIGGCCGTTPAHIAAFRAVVDEFERAGVRGRAPQPKPLQFAASAMTAVALVQDGSPLLIGERINAQGSRKIKRLLLEENYDEIMLVAREQVEVGAHLLDVCTALTERTDEDVQMAAVVKRLAQSVEAPLMIDSTEPRIIEAALKIYAGRPVVNSINLENGRTKLDDVMPLVQEAGAAVVALTIDETGMAKTAQRKLEVARRIHDIVTAEYALPPGALIFDALTFTLATGDAEFLDSAVETIEGIRAHQARAARRADVARRLQRLVRAQAGGARGAQLGDAASLRRGRARHGDRPRQRHHAVRRTRARSSANCATTSCSTAGPTRCSA